jgi:copper chaperone CopZ
MKKLTLEMPILYGDHHVIEVRKLLFEIPGVIDVYASSAFHMVEITYDPEKVNDLELQIKLDQAGYLGEWNIPGELGKAVESRSEYELFSRHTTVYETTRKVISFAQKVDSSQRPLWNCPGIGIFSTKDILKKMEE